MADWLPDTKPAWWDTVEDFASSPTRFIRTRLAKILVGIVIGFATLAVEAVQLYFRPLLSAIDVVGSALLVIPRTFNELTLSVWLTVRGVLTAVLGAGPLAPVLATGVTGLLLLGVAWVIVRTLVTAGSRIPVVSEVLKFLNIQ